VVIDDRRSPSAKRRDALKRERTEHQYDVHNRKPPGNAPQSAISVHVDLLPRDRCSTETRFAADHSQALEHMPPTCREILPAQPASAARATRATAEGEWPSATSSRERATRCPTPTSATVFPVTWSGFGNHSWWTTATRVCASSI